MKHGLLEREPTHNLNLSRDYALRMGGGLTKYVSRRACCNLKGGCITAASSRNAVVINVPWASTTKSSKLTGAMRVFVAGLVWVYGDSPRVLGSSFLESNFAMGT